MGANFVIRSTCLEALDGCFTDLVQRLEAEGREVMRDAI